MSGDVLVTGAGGFIGSAVFRLLVQKIRDENAVFADGAPVERAVALLRPGGSRERLNETEEHSGGTIVEADLTDAEATRATVREVAPRAIFHLALDAAVHDPLPEGRRRRLAVDPLERLVEALGEVGGDRYVHAGSCWVLKGGRALNETAELDPVTPYEKTKAWQAEVLPTAAEAAGVRWVNLRLFNTFGRYEDPSRLLPYLVRQLSRGEAAELAGSELIRDFNDVDDMAHAFLLALRAPATACDCVYHVGSGRGTAVREFADMVADVTGNRGMIRSGDGDAPDRHMQCLVADPGLARERLGWSVPAPLEERVHQAAEWWMARDGRDV